MRIRCLPLLFLCSAAGIRAQTDCPATAVYTPCDIVFELNDAEAAAHPNPYVSVDLRAEFRSASHRTYLMPAFWDGGRRMVIRFAPTESGDWDYRLSSNIQHFEGMTGKFQATAVDNPALGFIRVANLHHFAHTDANKNVPHLWTGDTSLRFAFMDQAEFQQLVDTRAKEKFNHLRGSVLGGPAEAEKIFPKPDRVDPALLRQVDERILAANRKGLIADLILVLGRGELTKLFPTWQDRERFIRYMVGRYGAMNITWQGVEAFDEYENGRELLKEIGLALKKLDPYQHLRSTGAVATSAPCLDDGWMDYITYRTADDQVGAIEHQLYGAPGVNVGAADSVDANTFRRRLWNAAMDGQYPSLASSGETSAFVAAWREALAGSRHWDLEPYFDVDGGRALALEDIEYLVYVEKPAQIEVAVEKHGYDVAWFNPLNGEWVKQKKEFKGEKFLGEPPDRTHDWVLRLSREGHKEGMLKSYRFEARKTVLQEVEQDSQKVPFEIAQPTGDSFNLSAPSLYTAKLKRETRATRSMMYLWTAEVATDGQGYRVAGTGTQGTLRIPRDIARHYPAVLQLRLAGMNANGKVYTADKIIQLGP